MTEVVRCLFKFLGANAACTKSDEIILILLTDLFLGASLC
jgi:hypothetical protein